MATPVQALAKLRNQPERFLRNYYLKTVRALRQSGPTTYWFGGTGYVDMQGNTVYDRTPRPGRLLGTLNMHNSRNFKFSPHAGEPVGDPIQLMAWHVDVSPSNGMALDNIPGLRVSRSGGPDLVLTTLLNGCSFVCEPRPTHVLMAHLQPTGGISAAQLEADILAGGAFAGGGGDLTVFGGGLCYTAATNDVTIIGVRTGQVWRMFAQVHPRNARHVSSAVRFFAD